MARLSLTRVQVSTMSKVASVSRIARQDLVLTAEAMLPSGTLFLTPRANAVMRGSGGLREVIVLLRM